MNLPIIILSALLVNMLAVSRAAGREPAQGLGLSAGVVGGLGFSYRYVPERGRLGVHVAIIGWKTGNDSYFHIATEPLYVLDNTETSALYVIGGAALIATESDSHWAGGVGLGFGRQGFLLQHTEQLWSSYELVLTAYREKILPYPQISVHYMLR